MHLRLTRRLRGCGFSCLRRDMVKVVAGEELLTRAQVLLIAQRGRFDKREHERYGTENAKAVWPQ